MKSAWSIFFGHWSPMAVSWFNQDGLSAVGLANKSACKWHILAGKGLFLDTSSQRNAGQVQVVVNIFDIFTIPCKHLGYSSCFIDTIILRLLSVVKTKENPISQCLGAALQAREDSWLVASFDMFFINIYHQVSVDFEVGFLWDICQNGSSRDENI